MSDAAYLEFDGVPMFFEAVTAEQGEHTATPTDHVVEKGANVTDHVRPGSDKVTIDVFVSNTPISDVNGIYGEFVLFDEVDVTTLERVRAGKKLEVPKADKPLVPTPGALINAVAGAIGDLLTGEKSHVAQIDGDVKKKQSTLAPQILRFSEKFNAPKDIVTLLDSWRKSATLGKVILPWKTYENMVITKVAPRRGPSTGDAAEISIELREIRLVESKLVTAPIPTESRGKTATPKGRQPTSFVRDPGPKQSTLRNLTK